MTEPFLFKYREFEVPLDWNSPDSKKISIIVREVILEIPDRDSKPPIICFQGGPGFGYPMPIDQAWITKLSSKFRVFLLDQRGTGLSTPVDKTELVARFASDPSDTLQYLTNFRSDSIAKDAEHIRLNLFENEETHFFGQSYGGWCAFSYLSLFPNSTKAIFLTGALPPIGKTANEVYRSLAGQVKNAHRNFLNQYPETEKQLKYLMGVLDIRTKGALSYFGSNARYSPNHEEVRGVIEQMYFEMKQIGRPSIRSLRMLEDPMGFESNPFYAALHESLYCDNTSSNWAGDTVTHIENELPDDSSPETFLLGECVFRNHFVTNERLSPMLPLMDAVMKYSAWPPLFDLEKIRSSKTAVFATVYENDSDVSKEYSLQTAELLENMEITLSARDHAAYKTHSDEIFDSMFEQYDELFSNQ